MKLGAHSSHISRADLTANNILYFSVTKAVNLKFQRHQGKGAIISLRDQLGIIDCDVLTRQSCRADVTDMVNRKQSVKR